MDNTVQTIQDKHEYIITFLCKCGIVCKNIHSLHNHMFPREVLLNDDKYEDIRKEIPTLKKIFSSSYMTSLQTTADKTQKWPLINIVRQVLKRIDFKLTPIRLCDGYNKDKKKKYKRMFLIEKIQNINDYKLNGVITKD